VRRTIGFGIEAQAFSLCCMTRTGLTISVDIGELQQVANGQGDGRCAGSRVQTALSRMVCCWLLSAVVLAPRVVLDNNSPKTANLLHEESTRGCLACGAFLADLEMLPLHWITSRTQRRFFSCLEANVSVCCSCQISAS
jgi:hypothetical protein